MNLPTTLAVVACALLATLVAGWLGARPAKPLAPPRLVPWRAIMLASFTLMVALLVHLVTLVKTH